MVNDYNKLVRKKERAESAMQDLQRQKDFKVLQLENKYGDKINKAIRTLKEYEKLVELYKEFVNEN